MKIFALFLLALTVASCSSPVSTAPPLATPTSGDLTIAFDKFIETNGYKQTQFVIFNRTDQSYWVYAYNKDQNAGLVTTSPLYQMEIKESNAWKEEFIGWCGTGADLYEVAPGEDVYFTSHIPYTQPQSMKVSLGFRTAKDLGASKVNITSNEVPLN